MTACSICPPAGVWRPASPPNDLPALSGATPGGARLANAKGESHEPRPIRNHALGTSSPNLVQLYAPYQRDFAEVEQAPFSPAHEGSEHLGQFVEEARRQGLLLVERRVEEAVASGEIGKNTNPAAVARHVLSVQQGMSIQARDGSTADELREVADAAMKAWPTLRKLENEEVADSNLPDLARTN